MTAAATTADSSALRFTHSDSKAVGMGGSLMDTLRDNAPRIVSGIKLAGDLALGFSFDPLMMVDSALSVTGRVITLVYGTKDNQRKLAQEVKDKSLSPEAKSSFAHHIEKVFKPREYPVESGAGFGFAAQAVKIVNGVNGLMKHGLKEASGLTFLILGAVGLYAYGNIVVGKEAKKDDAAKNEPLVFQQSESKPVGLMGRLGKAMKDNPMVVSSVLQLGVSFVGLAGGIATAMTNPAKGIPMVITFSLYIVANIIQTLFVRKNDFNIEGAQKQEQEQGPWAKAQGKPPESFQARSIQAGSPPGAQRA